jgi:prepilin-type processing-associated H-X9-DG protein
LVVISIIALLVGLLLPVLGAARGAARETRCKMNLRSLTQAALTYEADQQRLPPWYAALPGQWNDNRERDVNIGGVVKRLRPMEQSVLNAYFSAMDSPETRRESMICPVLEAQGLDRYAAHGMDAISFTYPLNWNCTSDAFDSERLYVLARIRNPSALGLFIEENPFRLTATLDEINDGQTVAPIWPAENDTLGTFHRAGSQEDRYVQAGLDLLEPDDPRYTGVSYVGFVDGHVAARSTLETVATLRDHPSRIAPHQQFE